MTGFDQICKWLSGVDGEHMHLTEGPDKLPAEVQPNTQQALQDRPTTERKGRSNEKYSARFLSLGPPTNLSPSQKPVANPSSQVNKYERRPRHKTRPDRYEYKGSSRADVKDSKRRRRKGPKLKRKHTLNDDFHASNVARSRLTLHSTPNTGIFQKGKTSSPVKSRELPDLAFSEMKFLFKEPQSGYKEHPLKHRETKPDGHKEQKQQKQPPDYSARFGKQTTLTPISKEGNLLFSGPGGSYSCRRPSPVHYHSPSKGGAQHGAEYTPRVNFPYNKSDNHGESQEKQVQPGSSFYTWSETNRCSSNDLFELCLGKILPVDITQRINGPIDIPPKSYKTEWDIEGLKSLLEDRKRLWDSKSACSDPPPMRPKKRGRCVPSEPERRSFSEQSREERRHATRGTSADSKKTVTGRETLYPGSPSVRLHPTENRQQDTSFNFSQKSKYPDIFHKSHSSKHCHSHCLSQRFGSSDIESPMLGSEVRWIDTTGPTHSSEGVSSLGMSDALFMQGLDAAYNKILSPETRRCVLQPRREDIPIQEDDMSTVRRYDETYDEFAATWTSHFAENADGLLPRHPEPYDLANEGNGLSHFVPRTISEKCKLHGGKSLPTTRPSPPRICKGVNEPEATSASHPCLEMAGFWRQNKLY